MQGHKVLRRTLHRSEALRMRMGWLLLALLLLMMLFGDMWLIRVLQR